MDTDGERRPRGRSYWVFHAEIASGDGVVLWLSGPAAGVYAIGEVAGEVEVEHAVEKDKDHRSARGRRSMSCLRRWSDVRPVDPILKPELLATGAFVQARIIRQPMGGNPLRLTQEEWRVIQALR